MNLLTLLESNLEYSEATMEGTIPTVGSDIINLNVNGRRVILREVGSAMASRWDKYLPECDCLMVLIFILFQDLLISFPSSAVCNRYF